MYKKEPIILIGGGGHCKSCIDVLEQEGRFQIVGIIDVKENIGKKVLGYEIIGDDDSLETLAYKYDHFLITVGQLKTAKLRWRLFDKLKKLGKKLPVIIAPTAHVSKHARIGEGAIIMHFATVNAAVKLGVNCIVNTKALVEHDAIVGDHNHISTAAVLNGAVQVGDACTIGSNSTLIQSVKLKNNILIGSGAVVLSDLSEAGVYVGTPAKKL